MNEKLIEYLKKHLEKGSDMQKVRQSLINAGHDTKIVEEHLKTALEGDKKRKYKSKTAKLLIALVILIIVAASCFYYFSKNYKPLLESGESKINETGFQKNPDIFKMAILANNASICNKIENDNLKNECKTKLEPGFNDTWKGGNFNATNDNRILNKALIKHNQSICNEIADDSIKSICKSKF